MYVDIDDNGNDDKDRNDDDDDTEKDDDDEDIDDDVDRDNDHGILKMMKNILHSYDKGSKSNILFIIHSFNQSINQSSHHSINQSSHHSINQAILYLRPHRLSSPSSYFLSLHYL
jgi:hypothetical protein